MRGFWGELLLWEQEVECSNHSAPTIFPKTLATSAKLEPKKRLKKVKVFVDVWGYYPHNSDVLNYNNESTTTTNMKNHKAEIITNPLSETVYRMNQKAFAEAEAINKKMREAKTKLADKQEREDAKKFWSQS